jgi:alanyl-tRNA synthetase
MILIYYREACCGTHVHKTGVIEHFCIINMKCRGSLSVSLKAVTGSLAQLTRLAGDNLKDRISKLETNFKTGNVALKELEYKIHGEKCELLDKKKRFPYVTVQESLEKLEILLKNIKIQERGKTRYVY